MYGNGDGTFQSPVNEGGGAAGNIVIADINSDGRNDVVSLGVLLAQPEGATTSATTLISSQNPAATADNITLTATVSPPEATGSVTFYDGSVVLGALTLSGGTASLTLNPLAAGSHSLKAVYSGGAGFSSSTSVLTETIVPEFTPGPILSNTLAVNLLVNGGAEDGLSGWYPSSPEATVVAETAPGGGTYSFEGKQAPSAFITQTLPIGLLGEAVDSQLNSGKFVANYSFWFADASPGSGSYGSITLTFLDRNGNLIGQGVSNPLQNTGTTTWINGTGSFPVPPGTEVVNYTMNFLTTSSVNSGLIDGNSLTIVGPTATTLTSSQNPAQPGDTISLTAGVSTGLQNDMVSFFDGSTLLGSASIGGDGAARLSVSNLALGNHSLRAVYAGNRADDSSTSNVLTEVILTEMPPGATVPNPLTSNLLVNPGAEQGTTGWYPASAGSIVTPFHPPPSAGSFSFWNANLAAQFITQTVNLTKHSGFTFAQVDSGKLAANYSFWFLNYFPHSGEHGEVTLTFLDANGVPLGQGISAALFNPKSEWVNGTGSFPIPPGTRTINYTMDFLGVPPAPTTGYMDDNLLTIRQTP